MAPSPRSISGRKVLRQAVPSTVAKETLFILSFIQFLPKHARSSPNLACLPIIQYRP